MRVRGKYRGPGSRSGVDVGGGGSPRGSSGGWQPAATVSVVTGSGGSAAATAATMVVEAQARGSRSADGDGSRAKPRVARAARSYSLALAPPAGRGCCYGYGARALTLTNGWPRVSRTQRRFYICRDTHLSVRGREGKREDGGGDWAEGMKREEETTAGDRRRGRSPATVSPLLGYCATLTESCHTRAVYWGMDLARPVYAPLMNGESDSRGRHRDYFCPKEAAPS